MSEATTAAPEAPQADAAATEEADFASGFDKAQGATPSPTSAPVTETPTEEPKTEQATTEAPTEAPATKPALIAGMTEAEWDAALSKRMGPLTEQLQKDIRKNFSQIGEMNRTVQDLVKKLSAGGQSASARKITAEALKRVSEELPGLGEALAADLSAIFDGGAQAQAEAKKEAEAKGQQFDPAAFTEKLYAEKIAPALAQLEARANEKAELRIVKSIHRDFDTVVKSPEFSAWLGTLPEERQKTVRESDDGLVAADAVTEFKGWADKAKKKKDSQNQRLEAAIAPKGDKSQSGPSVPDEDADFNRGFKTADRKYGSR